MTADLKNNMDNVKNNSRRTPRQHARRKSARGCEPSSLKLSSQLFPLFPTNTDDILAFNDVLGTTVGAKWDGKYSAAALTAFSEDLTVHSPTPTQNSNFFTGKPYVEGLGHAFLMRNYRAGLAKWQTADPLGYPDGWNQLAYCGNGVTCDVDLWGGVDINLIPKAEDLYSSAEICDPLDVISVAVHGSQIGVRTISPEDLAWEIANTVELACGYRKVLILSCWAGCNGFAQRLVDILHDRFHDDLDYDEVEVWAAPSKVYIDSEGRYSSDSPFIRFVKE